MFFVTKYSEVYTSHLRKIENFNILEEFKVIRLKFIRKVIIIGHNFNNYFTFQSFDHDKKICFEFQKKILHGLI